MEPTTVQWIRTAERNPRATGSFPVIEDGGLPNEWRVGFFDAADNTWAEAKYDTALIVPSPFRVAMWYPLPSPT